MSRSDVEDDAEVLRLAQEWGWTVQEVWEALPYIREARIDPRTVPVIPDPRCA